jgi:hypothetical protein
VGVRKLISLPSSFNSRNLILIREKRNTLTYFLLACEYKEVYVPCLSALTNNFFTSGNVFFRIYFTNICFPVLYASVDKVQPNLETATDDCYNEITMNK